MTKKTVTTFIVAALLTLSSFSAAFAVTNKELTSSIRKEIIRLDRANFGQSHVRVLAKDGTVYLRGTVDDVSQIKQYEQLAEQTSGVNQVVNQLSARSTN